MGADNWAICPRCKTKVDDDHAKALKKVMDSYGKVPVDRFDAMRSEVAERPDYTKIYTFREDYEIGVFGSDFDIAYHGECTACKLKKSYKYSETFAVRSAGQ